MKHKSMLINGEWVDSTDGRVIKVINPATEEIFAQVPIATKEDVNKAIKAADAAFPAWAKLSPAQRGGYLRKAGELVLERYEEIGSLMTEEQGKPVAEAQGEVKKAAEILQYYAEEGERVYGRIIADAEPDTESRIIYQPIGPAAAISPWNYPVELLAWKAGSALAAGAPVSMFFPRNH